MKRAYKRLAKQYHPDVCSELDAAARFNDIKQAYETIMTERTGNLNTVQTEEWRGKWMDQLKTMRKVERGQTAVNARRRRTVKPVRDEEQAAAAAADPGGAPDLPVGGGWVGAAEGESAGPGPGAEAFVGAGVGGESGGAPPDSAEARWQREQEMQWQVGTSQYRQPRLSPHSTPSCLMPSSNPTVSILRYKRTLLHPEQFSVLYSGQYEHSDYLNINLYPQQHLRRGERFFLPGSVERCARR